MSGGAIWSGVILPCRFAVAVGVCVRGSAMGQSCRPAWRAISHAATHLTASSDVGHERCSTCVHRGHPTRRRTTRVHRGHPTRSGVETTVQSASSQREECTRCVVKSTSVFYRYPRAVRTCTVAHRRVEAASDSSVWRGRRRCTDSTEAVHEPILAGHEGTTVQ